MLGGVLDSQRIRDTCSLRVHPPGCLAPALEVVQNCLGLLCHICLSDKGGEAGKRLHQGSFGLKKLILDKEILKLVEVMFVLPKCIGTLLTLKSPSESPAKCLVLTPDSDQAFIRGPPEKKKELLIDKWGLCSS